VGGEQHIVIALAAAVLGVGAFLLAFAPRLMALLVWPVVFCYPQNLFYGWLPWNAGLDDLFVILVGVRIILHARRDRVYPWARGAVLLALGMLIMEAIADFTGALEHRELLQDAVKSTLKGLVLLTLALLLAFDIRNERDVHRHVVAFGSALSLAFGLVVICFFVPSLARYWEVQFESLLYMEGLVAKRAFGPFNHPADVGISACVAVPFALGLLTHKPRRRYVALVGCALLVTALVALLIAKTRAGIVGLAGMFILMTLLSRQRNTIIAVEVVGILVTALFVAGGEFFGATQERLALERLSHDLATRFDLWARAITHPSPWIIFCGEGLQAFQLRLNATPHNGYLDAVFVWGLGGIIMFSLLVWKGVSWSSFVHRTAPDSCVRAIAWGYKWSFVSIGTLALVSDPWYSTYFRMMTYFLLVVVCSQYWGLRRQMFASEAWGTREGVNNVQNTMARYEPARGSWGN
jgi:hypothetical protein